MQLGELEMAVINWVMGLMAILLGSLVGSFVWWVKREFDKNDREHDRTYRSIIRIHKRLDSLVPDKCYDD